MTRPAPLRATIGLALVVLLAACAGNRRELPGESGPMASSSAAAPSAAASSAAAPSAAAPSVAAPSAADDLVAATAGVASASTVAATGAVATGDTASGRPRPAESMLLVEDRFEGFNRSIYRFNFEFDHYVFLPIVRAYQFIVPRPVRTGISNFFSNLGEIRNAGNGLLQARPEVASRATIRFLVNSTIGLLGFFDVATRLGVDQQREDFGQTLGWWGVGAGPYLVLPLLGPSSVRDTVGLPADFALGTLVPPGAQINDVVYSTPAPYAVEAVDARYTQPFRYYDSGSAFEYDLVRFLYFRAREAEVRK